MKKIVTVNSEIGKLKTVLLKRPGREVENIIPEFMERLLFDDIPYLPVIQTEHDTFATVLQENGTEVLYLEELVLESLKSNQGILSVVFRVSHRNVILYNCCPGVPKIIGAVGNVICDTTYPTSDG